MNECYHCKRPNPYFRIIVYINKPQQETERQQQQYPHVMTVLSCATCLPFVAQKEKKC